MLYTNTYLWNLEKWYWSTYLQGPQWRHRHRERTYGHGEGGEGEGAMYAESNMETYVTVCKIGSQWEFAVWLRELKPGLCDNLVGWHGEGGGRKFLEGGNIYTSMADSCWCLAETNTIVWNNYPSIKKKKVCDSVRGEKDWTNQRMKKCEMEIKTVNGECFTPLKWPLFQKSRK